MASIESGGVEEVQNKLKLYSYWRSSCSCRVRIALNLKGQFRKLNPIGYVPVLVDGDVVISDSLAIIMYLEEKYPQHPLLPHDLQQRAINYQAANIVSSSIQPLQNLNVLKYIGEKVSPDEKIPWVQHHIGNGFAALEKLLKDYSGKYATGDEVFLADLFLAPQIHGAINRFNLDMANIGDGVVEVPKNKLKLYSFWRSSCAGRVRIALNLKGLEYECIAINLVKGEQYSPADLAVVEFRKLNPVGHVPVLVDGDVVISDSFAIIMYLEEKYPQHPLLPNDLQQRVINYQAASIVSSSIQPFQNMQIQKYIGEKVGPDEKIPWVQHHIGNGFAALEKLLNDYSGKYATGDEVFLADLFVAPQIHGAINRFNLNMTEFPLLSRLNEAYQELPAFQDAMPEKQPDTPLQERH
ncbi:hypothetical protein RJ640_008722 [Escallonia rubra]|uniref:glutathione transferase n=1 Tax=Escallonia rubra TaxID=112253 RepID=A0AA88RH57_9ASTE|nr:hypothetical protein RJ640_008722 [Escallonia rubra]